MAFPPVHELLADRLEPSEPVIDVYASDAPSSPSISILRIAELGRHWALRSVSCRSELKIQSGKKMLGVFSQEGI